MSLGIAIDYLKKPGAVGVLPTDTVYGLVARASDQAAVGRLYRLKSREHKPGTLIAASVEQLVDLGIKRRYLMAVKDYWPGPLSVIIPSGSNLDYLHLGVDGLAVRIPDHKELQALLIKTGPLITTSANVPGHMTAETLEDAKKYFGDKVDFYIDGGNLSGHQPSTVIRIVDDAIEVLRAGAYKINDQS